MISPELRRKLAPAVLLIGAALALGLLKKDAPRDHEITVKLEGSRQTLTRVELRVLGANNEEESTASFHFEPGKAPPAIHGKARVIPGRWRVQIGLELGPEARVIDRTVTLEGDPVTIPVRIE